VSYDEMAALTFGSAAAIAVPIVNVFAIFGGCVSYVAIVVSVLPQFLELVSWAGPFSTIHANSILWTGVIVAVVVLPLCLLENLSSLRFSSVFGLCFTVYLIVLICEQALSRVSDGKTYDQHALWDPTYHGGVAVSCSIFNFAYVLHFNVVPLYQELEGASVERMVRVVRLVVVVTTCIYLVVGCSGLLLYEEDTQSNVLLNFDTTVAYMLARGAVCFAVVFAFPLIFFPLRVTIHNLAILLLKLRHVEPKAVLIPECLTILGVVFTVAVAVPNLGVVFSVTGGTSVVCIVYLFPIAFSLKYDMGQRMESQERLLTTVPASYESIGADLKSAGGAIQDAGPGLAAHEAQQVHCSMLAQSSIASHLCQLCMR